MSRAWTKLGFGALNFTTSAVSLAGATAAVSALRTGIVIFRMSPRHFEVHPAGARPAGCVVRQTSMRLMDRLLR